MKQHKIPLPQTKGCVSTQNFPSVGGKILRAHLAKNKKSPSLIRRRVCSFIWYQCLRGAAGLHWLHRWSPNSQPHSMHSWTVGASPDSFLPCEQGLVPGLWGQDQDVWSQLWLWCTLEWLFPVLEPDSGHLDTHLHLSLSRCCCNGMSNQIHWLQCMIPACRPCTDVQSSTDLSPLENPA